jgi:hypothetical protein
LAKHARPARVTGRSIASGLDQLAVIHGKLSALVGQLLDTRTQLNTGLMTLLGVTLALGAQGGAHSY